MSLINIHAALETAINGMSPALATVWDNTPYTPVVGTPYQRVALIMANPENPQYGSGYQELGIMQITLFYPSMLGSAAANARIDLIRSTFKRGSTFSSGGINVVINKTPSISTSYNDGMHFAIPVKIYFYSNIL